MNDREEKVTGRKQGAYNVGSLTGRIDALNKGEVLMFPFDTKTIMSCRNSVKRIEANKPKASYEVIALDAYNADEWHMKLIKIERLK